MAARLGAVTVPVDVEFQGQALRAVALEKALQLASANANADGMYVATDTVIESAEKIEKYLKGGESNGGS
ncbi:hypothetical protein SEA_RASOVI_60 [Microbacterium phage Rasovi]|nr:hypothetical protein SEA_RASOVI_60 [Microbacterium phage Rasovi]